MAIRRTCPPPKVLTDLLEGKLVDPDLSDLSLHLEDCPRCQETAQTILPTDTLIESLRGDAPMEDRIAQSAPRILVERLKQIPQVASSANPAGPGELASLPADQHFDFLEPPQSPDEIGRLGSYRILQTLGQGGMGIVFLAEDLKLGRRVALKARSPRLAADPASKDRFLREARAAARLKNDHIVVIYQVDEANGIPFLAMELLEGSTLDRALPPGGVLTSDQIIRIARDIARGLAHAHEKRLIHRDIKPSNLWLEGSFDTGRVKILDFGLVSAETDDVHLTGSGAIIGTPGYLSPEQGRGEKVDARADLFSLGCVLYRLATGNPPFQSETTFGALTALAVDTPVAANVRNPEIPPELSRLIMELLAKDPAQRPQTAGDVLARLDPAEKQPTAVAPASESSSGGWRVGIFAGLVFVAMALAAIAIFWQTPDGRVVRIECSDPSIQIAFDKAEMKVIGAYREPIIFQPGKVALRVARKGTAGGDFDFETDKFVVNRGDIIGLRVELVTGEVRIVQSGKGVIDAKAIDVEGQRRAWTESVAKLKPREQATEVVKRLKQLHPNFHETSLIPILERDSIAGLRVEGAAALRDLSPLRAFSGLKDLVLVGNGYGRLDFEGLRGMQLSVLDTNGCRVFDLSPLAGMPLQKAYFWGIATTDLSPLSGMKLVEVNVGNSHVKDIAVLRKMPLEFVCANISPVEDLSPLEGAPLKRLFIANTKVKSLKPVTGAPIEWLCIDGSPVEDLTPLLSMRLRDVELDNPRNHAELLRKIPTLRTINKRPSAEVLGDSPTSADSERRVAAWAIGLGATVQLRGGQEFKQTADLPADPFVVTGITLRQSAALQDDDLRQLQSLKSLALLDINGTSNLTNAGLAQLKDLRSLELLDISRSKIDDAGLVHLKGLASLTALHLDTTAVTNDGVAHLKDMTRLRILGLANTKVTDAALAHLDALSDLREFSLFNTAVTNEGLARLKRHPQLQRIDLSYTSITDDGLAHLRELTNLNTIHLRCRMVTDAGLLHLRVLKKLHLLEVQHSKITVAGLIEFRKSIPKCDFDLDLGGK